ncbi:PAS domain-containing protein [Ruminiclostridium cellobioparum]|uniref:PAS domain-containing protein n=1 Tax=Ruminiclostridium cellobioparum TaxID=29355 RepID=UPI000488C8F1|nr:PAS domain-containing protein [Ruminiclostridium cellobioparum]
MYDFFDILMKIVLVISLILSLAIIIFSSLRGKRTLLLTSFVIFQSMFALLCATQLLQYMETLVLFISLLISAGIWFNIFCLIFRNRLGLIHIGNVAAFLNIAISSVIFSVLTLKYRFLNIAAAFKKIVDSLEDAVFFIDMFGKITYYNDSFVRTFELEVSRKKYFEADIFCRRLMK